MDGMEQKVSATPDAVGTPITQETQGLDYSSLINSDGTFKETFHSSLPEDLGNHSVLKKYQSIEDLAKGTINASSLVGKKAEEFWKSEDPDVVATRRSIMGIPDSADGYELSKPASMPDEIGFDDVQLNSYKTLAHEIGLTTEQASKLLEWDADRAQSKIGEVADNYKATVEKAETELRGDWGNKFDYNIGKIKQATDFLGLTEELNETGLANNPTVLKAIFDKIVPAISDDKLIEGAKSDNYATMEDELNQIDSKLLSMDSSDPSRKALLSRKLELLQKIS